MELKETVSHNKKVNNEKLKNNINNQLLQNEGNKKNNIKETI